MIANAALTALVVLAASATFAAEESKTSVAPIYQGGAGEEFIKDGAAGGTDEALTKRKARKPGTGADGDSVVVPEPATIALLGLGLTALGLSRRKKKEA